ncbi:g8571 [Coccomyxa elongata]
MAGAGEHMVTIATHLLVIGFMKMVLRFLGISFEPYNDSVEPSGAGATSKRPDAQLFLRSILMFKVMHTTLYALTIVLQQTHHQLCSTPSPFGTSWERRHLIIYFQGEYIEKQADVRQFGHGDIYTLLHVYDVLLKLPNGADICHPPGLVRPLGMPRQVGDRWEIQMFAARFVLIDFDNSGLVDTVPPFPPRSYWAPECRLPNTPYTIAADIYSVGMLMAECPLGLDSQASSLWQLLTADDAAQRSSASIALEHPWLSGAS